MAIFFNDTFTEAVDTTLASHTPDTGTSWTRVYDSGVGSTLDVKATTDRMYAINSSLNEGVGYTADATYPNADYEVEFTLSTRGAGADAPIHILLRYTDNNNFYICTINFTATCQIYRKVGGVFTALGATFAIPAAGAVCVFGVRGTTLYFIASGVQSRVVDDPYISATGKAAVFAGGGASMFVTGYDLATVWEIDAFSINSYVAQTRQLKPLRPAIFTPGMAR